MNRERALKEKPALIIILILYRNVDKTGVGKSLREIWLGFLKVIKNLRFMAIIIIVGGFWAIQHQLYATMPKYVLRTVGESASPEWYANVNPLVVILFVLLFGSFFLARQEKGTRPAGRNPAVPPSPTPGPERVRRYTRGPLKPLNSAA